MKKVAKKARQVASRTRGEIEKQARKVRRAAKKKAASAKPKRARASSKARPKTRRSAKAPMAEEPSLPSGLFDLGDMDRGTSRSPFGSRMDPSRLFGGS